MKKTKEEYLTKYANDPDALELIAELEETDEKLKKLEIDVSKMAVMLRTLGEPNNWVKNKIFGADKTHSVFVAGGGRTGSELLNYIANQMGLM